MKGVGIRDAGHVKHNIDAHPINSSKYFPNESYKKSSDDQWITFGF